MQVTIRFPDGTERTAQLDDDAGITALVMQHGQHAVFIDGKSLSQIAREARARVLSGAPPAPLNDA